MNNIELYFKILVAVQLLHSLEEIYTRFDVRWPVWKMSQRAFIVFELFFSVLIVTVAVVPSFPLRPLLMASFNVLMFANGVWHLMWFGIEKRYVPGLVTAPLFIITFLIFYFKII